MKKKEFKNFRITFLDFIRISHSRCGLKFCFAFSDLISPEIFLFMKEICDYILEKNNDEIFINDSIIFIPRPDYLSSTITLVIEWKRKIKYDDFIKVNTLLFDAFKHFFTKKYYETILFNIKDRLLSRLLEYRRQELGLETGTSRYQFGSLDLSSKISILSEFNESVTFFLNDKQRLYFKAIETL